VRLSCVFFLALEECAWAEFFSDPHSVLFGGMGKPIKYLSVLDQRYRCRVGCLQGDARQWLTWSGAISCWWRWAMTLAAMMTQQSNRWQRMDFGKNVGHKCKTKLLTYSPRVNFISLAMFYFCTFLLHTLSRAKLLKICESG
jgi:hypothetical protein